MPSIVRALLAVGAPLLGSIATSSNAFDTTYRLTELATLGGDISSASGINNLGQVVGAANKTASAFSQAVVWQNGAPMELGNLGGICSDAFHPSGPCSFAAAINDRGEIVGSSNGAGNIQRAALWSNGTVRPLRSYDDRPSIALGINQSNRIVGEAYVPDPSLPWDNTKALHWAPDGSVSAMPTRARPWGTAWGINDAGTVVGYTRNDEGESRAIAWVADSPYDLGTLGGNSFAQAINTQGTIVGSSFTAADNNYYHAVRWSDYLGSIVDLGTLGGVHSWAAAVNSRGLIVGSANTSDEMQHAFIWADGTMFDLNDRLDASGADWLLGIATAINERGQIVGNGINPEGQFRAFVLTPIPEPSIAVLMLIGIGLFATFLPPKCHRSFGRSRRNAP